MRIKEIIYIESEGRNFIAFEIPYLSRNIKMKVFPIEDYGIAKSGIYIETIHLCKKTFNYICDHELNTEYKFFGQLDNIKNLRFNKDLREKINVYYYLIEIIKKSTNE